MSSDQNSRKILVIIPAFNEQDNILAVINKISKDFSILVVDDGSTDNTAKLIQEQENILLVKHQHNRGVGAALKTGIDYALKNKFDIAVNIDADGQFDPAQIPDLIRPITEAKADLVVGNRFRQGRPDQMSSIKYAGNLVMNKLISYLCGQKYPDVSSGFRAYSREALLHLNLFGRFTYTQESFLNLYFNNLNIVQLPVSVRYFKGRQSKVAHNLFVYGYRTLSIILRSIVYYKPFRFFGLPGIVSLIIGFACVAFLLIHYALTGAFSPYKAWGFIGGGMVLFGLILVFIGLLADLIDKVRQVQEKTLYYQKKQYYR